MSPVNMTLFLILYYFAYINDLIISKYVYNYCIILLELHKNLKIYCGYYGYNFIKDLLGFQFVVATYD